MTKDLARGERVMRQANPIKVDRENDVSPQGVSSKPSWQDRSYGHTALESDTMQPIPEHFMTGSWMNRFGGQSPPTEQGSSKLNNVEATHGNGAQPSNTLPQKPVLVASAVVPMTMGQFVARQIAVRSPALAAKAAGLSLVDGPLPIGEILALGLTAWTAFEIYREWQKYQHIMQSTHDHGGGKNAQHGKSEDRPSDLRKLKELEDQLETAQGKDKKNIKKKIDRLRQDMARRRKGENHSQGIKR
jgi:hypothetical protein